MTDHKTIYQQDAYRYQELITWEDYRDNILPAIQELISLKGLHIMDLGAGTGRLSTLLAPLSSKLVAVDLSQNMLEIAVERLKIQGTKKWAAAVADHRFLPVENRTVDLVISGWSFCYLAVWEKANWREELDRGLAEVFRVLQENGMVILIETLGTGTEEPEAPKDLIDYYQYLERIGFQKRWIRTDYRFNSVEDAEELTRFFFGEEMISKIIPENKPILPECTGIWWLKI